MFKKNFKVPFLKNNFHTGTINKFNCFSFIFPNKVLKNMTLLLSKLLFSGVNFLVLDNDYNYNYLPTNNTYSSNKLLYKTINYFNIRVLFFLNLKPGTIKKFSNLNLLNITLTNNYNLNNVGFSSKFKNLRIFHYMLYIYILGVYSTM